MSSMQNSSAVFNKASKNLTGHRRTHSSSDYDISNFSKNRHISPKTSKNALDINDLTPNINVTQTFIDNNKKKTEEPHKEYIIEPLEITPEEQRILAGKSKYSKENLNFGKNPKYSDNLLYNSFNQMVTSNNKETMVEKYRKQLEEQKISTILEKNDVLSNEDSSFIEEKKSPILNKISEFISKSEQEKEKKLSFRKKNFHSNSQDLNVEKNLLNCNPKIGQHSKNSPSQQVFTIYLNGPNKNEKQLDKIIHQLKVIKKVPEVNFLELQNKTFRKNNSTIGNFNNQQNFQNKTENNKQNNNENNKQNNSESVVKSLEKRVFLLENEMIGFKTENNKLKQNNLVLMKKMQDKGYVEIKAMIQVRNQFILL